MHILLTGASGVIGTALLPALAPARVTALVHRHPAGAADRSVAGDITAARFGLTGAAYTELARDTDVVVHCAARTGFALGRAVTADANVAGTRTVVRFAADAGAPLYHVSTAFVARHTTTGSSDGARPEDYVDSKRAAEDAVRTSGQPAMIIRPSVVIGDSLTGHIGRFQGLHDLSMALLRNQLPLVPMPAGSRIDFLPSDVVARSIAALVNAGRTGEAWITAGPAALEAAVLADVAVTEGRSLGLDVRRPRMVDRDMVDRLIRPVFVDPLAPAAQRRFDDLLAITALFAGAPVFPTSLGGLPPLPPAPDAGQLAEAYRNTIRHIVELRRLAPVLQGMAA